MPTLECETLLSLQVNTRWNLQTIVRQNLYLRNSCGIRWLSTYQLCLQQQQQQNPTHHHSCVQNVSKSLQKVRLEMWFGHENVSLNAEFMWNNPVMKM